MLIYKVTFKSGHVYHVGAFDNKGSVKVAESLIREHEYGCDEIVSVKMTSPRWEA